MVGGVGEKVWYGTAVVFLAMGNKRKNIICAKVEKLVIMDEYKI